MTAEAMSDPAQVTLAKEHHAEFGDEIGLSFHGLTHKSVTELVGYGQEALWLFSMEHKRTIISALADRFTELFGHHPVAVASYHIDSSTMRLVREIIPSATAAVAGCFEEGVRVFHGCNHSWYLFNEGMPWGPWYPSKSHTLRPARDTSDWCGVVAIPHLMRDMVLSYEGRNDFWASHPPNVMRGMGYEGEDCPYDRNLIDMFLWQEQFSGGYSYYNSFVSTAWLAEHHAIDDKPEVAQSLYRQQLEYLGELKLAGRVDDLTMSEFAERYRSEREPGESEIFFAKELLYGTGKHYFWYLDADQRVLLDATQGGSIGDLRPYAGEVSVETGPESPSLAFGSYPFLIQSQHRTGMQNHFQDGSRSTVLVECDGETVDLGTVPTRIGSVNRMPAKEEKTIVEFEPSRFSLGGTEVTVATVVTFESGGRTRITRRWESGAPVVVTERFKLAPGVTEYPQPLHGVVMKVSSAENDDKQLEYAYNGREITKKGCILAMAEFPSVSTRVTLAGSDSGTWTGTAGEGHLFSPYVTLALSRTIHTNEETEVCLQIEKR